MRPPTALAVLLLALAVAAPARDATAQRLKSRTQYLLDEAVSAADLRGRLAALADSARRRAPNEAGEALYYLGQSWERSGGLDSAVAAYRAAALVRGNAEDRIALADVLLARRQPGDVAEALRLMESSWAEAAQGGGLAGSARHYRARQAWAEHLLGRGAEALGHLEPLDGALAASATWRERLGIVALAAGQPRRAWDVLLPLAAESRGEDPAVMRALRDAGDVLGLGPRVDEDLRRAVAALERAEAREVERLGGRAVRFAAADGFPLAGTVVVPPGGGRHRAVVALRAPGDTLGDWDSLAAGLRASGRALVLVDPRGHGASIAPSCALPSRWWGREDELAALTADDLRHALRALALVAPVDTARVVVVASGAGAGPAAAAAERDRRVEALVLLSPDPPATARGALRARLARLAMPGYFQIGVEDRPSFLWVETLYQAGDRARSRVVDARGPGLGPRAMRADPESVTRLVRWLDAPKPARRAPRPQPRRPG